MALVVVSCIYYVMANFLLAQTMRSLSTFIDVHKRKKNQNMDPTFLE